MSNSPITTRRHLLEVAEDGIAQLEQAAKAWLEEDARACTPRSQAGAGPISGGSRSDPVESLATGRDLDDHQPSSPVDVDKYRDRDRIGHEILDIVGRLQRLVERQQPRQTGGPCNCCETETATHGSDDHGDPAECFACWRYRRQMGFHCTDEIHQHRPQVRMCDCPAWCCDVCPDRAADGRQVSERCKRRMTRRRADQEAAAS